MSLEWSNSDIEILKLEYQKGTSCINISKLLNKSYSSIRSKASKLDLKTIYKPLLKINIDYIKNKIINETATIAELSRELKVSKSSLLAYCKRHNYNYKQDYTFLHINKTKRRLTKGESGFKSLIKNYKEAAVVRKYLFELSENEFKYLTQQNCHYCNIPPSQKVKTNSKDTWGEYLYNGIDRIDNTQGYNLKNCVSCCGTCNQMKMAFSYDQFIDKIKCIYNKLVKE